MGWIGNRGRTVDDFNGMYIQNCWGKAKSITCSLTLFVYERIGFAFYNLKGLDGMSRRRVWELKYVLPMTSATSADVVPALVDFEEDLGLCGRSSRGLESLVDAQ